MLSKPVYAVIICLCAGTASMAQKGINSIYSAYGIGDVDLRDHSGYYGMGGIGVAMPSDNTLNNLNPASYSVLPRSKYMLDLSFGGKSVTYVNETQNIPAGDFTISRASFGMSLFKNWGAAFGLKRYSNIDYFTEGTRSIEGTTVQLTDQIQGSGGLNLVYFSNGFKVTKNLSLGVSTGFLFGSQNRQESISTSSTSAANNFNVENNVNYTNALVTGGLQYTFKTGKLVWMAGGTYQPSMKLNKITDDYLKDQNGNILVQNESAEGKFEYPDQWSAGLSVRKKGLRIGADYIQQNWQNTNYQGSGFTTTTGRNWAAGVSKSFPQRTIFGTLEDGNSISAGIQYDKSYLVIANNEITSLSGTVGGSLVSRNGLYRYSFGIKVGQRGRAAYPLVKEKFVEFNFNISLSGFFFQGGRKYE